MNRNNSRRYMKMSMQKRLFIYMSLVFVFILICLFSAVITVTRNRIYSSEENRYRFVNEKAYLAFLSNYESIDALADAWIVNNIVQKTFSKEKLSISEGIQVKRSMSIFQNEKVDYYLFLDPKNNIYSQKNISKSATELYETDILKAAKGYSKTCFYWGKDEIFGDEGSFFFLVRKIQSIEGTKGSGILCLRMNDDFIKQLFDPFTVQNECAHLLYRHSGELIYNYNPLEYHFSQNVTNWIDEQYNCKDIQIQNGLIASTYDSNSDFYIITYVPKEILNQAMTHIYILILIIFVITIILSMTISNILSRKITKPIAIINQYMHDFDDTKLDTFIELHTGTELDTIGQSYNSMLGHIKALIEEVKETQTKARNQEIKSLVNQLQPHFLYNTLDNIYMLARINKEDTIMKMIYALSRYLRINLSKGADIITIERELEHVTSYMDIQMIRNNQLFTYEIDCPQELKQLLICKIILQPLAENAIKHGFSDIDRGGRIYIRIMKENSMLKIEFENSGNVITDEALNYLNKFQDMDITLISDAAGKGEGGYGIVNVITRLRLKYGDQVRFYYKKYRQSTVCVIEIPCKENNE